MNWTKEKPTEGDNHYHFREEGGKGRTIVFLSGDGDEVVTFYNGRREYLGNLRGEFAGPIPEPTEGKIPTAPALDATEAARALTLRNSAPERIFLNLGPPDSLEDPCVFGDLDTEEITWCPDRIENYDVEYIRADLVEPPQPTKEGAE